MTVVAAFLNTADGVTPSDTADKVDYFVINDGDTNNVYVYKFVDNGDGTTDVQAAELSLIATVAADGAVGAGAVDIA